MDKFDVHPDPWDNRIIVSRLEISGLVPPRSLRVTEISVHFQPEIILVDIVVDSRGMEHGFSGILGEADTIDCVT